MSTTPTTPPAGQPPAGQPPAPPAPAGQGDPGQQQPPAADDGGLKRALEAERRARRDAEARAKAAEDTRNALLGPVAQALGLQPPAAPGTPGAQLNPATGLWPAPPAPAGPSAEQRYQQRVFELEVKAAAAGKTHDPADVVALLAGQRADLSTPDGDPDGRLIADAVAQLLQRKPHLAVAAPPGDGAGHQQSPAGGPPAAPPPMAGSADQGTRKPPTDRAAADAQANQWLAQRFGTPAAPTAPPAT